MADVSCSTSVTLESTPVLGGRVAMVRQDRASSRATPRLACNRTEAAQALGVSVDFFDEHVSGELSCVRRGRLRLYPIAELERWLERAAERLTAMQLVAVPFGLHAYRMVHVGHIAVLVLLGALPWC